jgi:hypothetical protein
MAVANACAIPAFPDACIKSAGSSLLLRSTATCRSSVYMRGKEIEVSFFWMNDACMENFRVGTLFLNDNRNLLSNRLKVPQQVWSSSDCWSFLPLSALARSKRAKACVYKDKKSGSYSHLCPCYLNDFQHLVLWAPTKLIAETSHST